MFGDMIMSTRSRRIAGAVLGLVLGVLYGGASGAINAWALPDVPLRLDAGAIVADTIFAGLGALAAGYLTAWPESSFKGVAGGAGAIAAFLTLRAVVAQATGLDSLLRAVLVLIPIFLPSVALSLPITGLLRLGVNWYGDALSYSGRPRLFRLGRLALGVAAVGLLAGSLSRMTADEQAALRQVNLMIQNGLAARSEAQVPRPLRNILGFSARAAGSYTLDPRVEVGADLGFADSSAVQTIWVEVLFDNGLRFHCLVGQTLAEPLCAES